MEAAVCRNGVLTLQKQLPALHNRSDTIMNSGFLNSQLLQLQRCEVGGFLLPVLIYRLSFFRVHEGSIYSLGTLLWQNAGQCSTLLCVSHSPGEGRLCVSGKPTQDAQCAPGAQRFAQGAANA